MNDYICAKLTKAFWETAGRTHDLPINSSKSLHNSWVSYRCWSQQLQYEKQNGFTFV